MDEDMNTGLEAMKRALNNSDPARAYLEVAEVMRRMQGQAAGSSSLGSQGTGVPTFDMASNRGDGTFGSEDGAEGGKGERERPPWIRSDVVDPNPVGDCAMPDANDQEGAEDGGQGGNQKAR